MNLEDILEQLAHNEEDERIDAIQALWVLVRNRPQQRSVAQRIYCDHLRARARGPKETQAVLDILCKGDEDQPFCPSESIQLQGANLQGADLQMANLQWANLQGVNLERAYLQMANLQRVNLERANLQGVNLQGVNLHGVNLRGAYLRGAYLLGAYLRGAYLRGAYLLGAYLRGAYLLGANLQGAVVWETTGETAEMPPETLTRLNALWEERMWQIGERAEEADGHKCRVYTLTR